MFGFGTLRYFKRDATDYAIFQVTLNAILELL